MPDEQTLSGGNTNKVVRIGNTVRREMGPQSKTVHAYLGHLAKKGVRAPRFIGIDEKGREILSFIEGETGIPNYIWESDVALVESARLLRELHDASLDFELPLAAEWALTTPDPDHDGVICHHDFAPYNMVFDRGRPIAILDFDVCGPGPRRRDLAYLAYWMAPLSFSSDDLTSLSEHELASGCPRLKLLCQAYGEISPRDVLMEVSGVLHHMSSPTAMTELFDAATTAKLKQEGHLDHWMREAEAFDQKRDSLLTALKF